MFVANGELSTAVLLEIKNVPHFGFYNDTISLKNDKTLKSLLPIQRISVT